MVPVVTVVPVIPVVPRVPVVPVEPVQNNDRYCTGDGQKHPFPLLLPVAPDLEKFQSFFSSVARLVTHTFLVPVYAVVVIKVFAKTITV